jgi:D-alanyl-D-alanine carboxypeptidase
MWVQSGFRSYGTQERLYNNYVARDGKKEADKYSARPGHSEHQTGLAFDVCATNRPCISNEFDNTPEAKWLSDNCYKYGFILRYVKGKENETGYQNESWHFRYVGKDIAKELYNNGDWITLEDYLGVTSEYSD